MSVMKDLKDFVNDHIESGKKIESPKSDHVLDLLRELVGERWATNDPAILIGEMNAEFKRIGNHFEVANDFWGHHPA